MEYINVETVMTYDQWKEEHKKRIKKQIKRKFFKSVKNIMYCISLSLILFGLPALMVLHYLYFGY